MSLNIDFGGIPEDLSTESPGLAFQRFQNIANGAESGFFRLPFLGEHLGASQDVRRRFGERKNFLHLGIGGSSLGPEMLVSALGRPSAPRFEFVNNVDPDILSRQLEDVHWGETLVFGVSKSGNTPETLASLAAIRHRQGKDGAGSTPPQDLFVVATEPGGGKLGRWAEEQGVSRLPLPRPRWGAAIAS